VSFGGIYEKDRREKRGTWDKEKIENKWRGVGVKHTRKVHGWKRRPKRRHEEASRRRKIIFIFFGGGRGGGVWFQI
jgi:hypothetical protein